jgi:hypothetical protein
MWAATDVQLTRAIEASPAGTALETLLAERRRPMARATVCKGRQACTGLCHPRRVATRMTFKTGVFLLVGALFMGVLCTQVLIQWHRRYTFQYEYGETFPLGRTTFYIGLALTLTLVLTGISCLVGATTRPQSAYATTTTAPGMPAGKVRVRRSAILVGVGSLGLLALAVAMLAVGHFIQFDDTTGFGADAWVMPLGLGAGLAAIVAVIVAQPDRLARRLLGGALLVINLLTVWKARTDDGFRFIYNREEGELLFLQVVLATVALLLLAGSRPTRRLPVTEPPPTKVPIASPAQQSLLHAAIDTTALRIFTCALALGYTAVLVPTLVQTARENPFIVVTFGIGLVCGWAATRAGTRHLAATLWVIAALLTLYGASGPMLAIWLHALLAFGVLVLWMLARQATTPGVKAALVLTTIAAASTWALLGVVGGMMLGCEHLGGCLS